MTRKVVSPIALDKSINTTEQTPRNIADVLAQQLEGIKTAIETGNGNLEAAFVCYYGVTTATQIKDAIEDGKVPYFYYNGAVAQLWKVETDKYTFRTTNTRSVEGQTILDVVDYIVNGSVWSTVTREVSGGSSSGQSYIASVNSLADFDTTGKSGMQDLISVMNVPSDGVYLLSVLLHITPKSASATKSDLVIQFNNSDNTGWPSHTFHAVVDDSQTFAQQLSFSTSVSLKAGQNTLRIQCGGLNTEYLVFVDELTVAQLANGVYTTVQDGSIGIEKLTDSAKNRLENPFVTPEEFGAVGDGVHDDSDAIQAAINFARNVNRGCYVVLKASNGYKYRVEKNILLYNGVTLQGSTRWGAWIDLHEGAQVCLANNWVGSSTEESRLKFVTIDGNDTSDYCVRSGNNDDDYVVTQCVLEDVYMKNGRIAACYFRGTISQFNHCYFYYSPTGLVARRCNAVTLRDCNFWDVGTTLDLDRCTNINFIADWFEGGNESDRGRNNLQIKVSNNSNVFFENCQFQGTVSNTQYILKQLNTDPRNNYSLYFNQCRFNYPNAENPLFEFQGWDNIHLQIENSYFYVPLISTAIINNSHTQSPTALKFSIHNNTAFDDDSKAVPIFTDPDRGVATSVYADNGTNTPQLPNGIILGPNRVDTEAHLLSKVGYTYFDTMKHKIRTTNGAQWNNVAIEYYITPEEFGAVGDGTTDDSAAIQAAINAAQGSAAVLLTKYSYAIANDIQIPNASTFRGDVRHTNIKLLDGAKILLGQTGSAAEIRISNLTIDANNTSDYCITNYDPSATASNIYISSVYFENATIADLSLKVQRGRFQQCYFYDAPVGVKIDGNYNIISQCFVGDVTTGFDFTGIFLTISSTVMERVALGFALADQSLVNCEDSVFIGPSGDKRMLNETSNKSITMAFTRCRINYTNVSNTSPIFTVACGTTENIYLRFADCEISAYYATAFIDNSLCADIHFHLEWYNVSSFGTSSPVTSNTGYKLISTGLSQNQLGIPELSCGGIIGSNKPATDNYLNNYNGFLRYDTTSHRLIITSNGSQRLIPVETVGSLTNLSSTATLDIVIARFNDLLTMLRESHVLKT